MIHRALFSFACFCLASEALAVTNQAELQTALQNLDVTITIENAFGTTQNLFPVNSDLAFVPQATISLIDGGNFLLSGNATNRGFFIHGGTVTIQNCAMQGFRAKGGNGGNGLTGGGGGGGAGLGGAVYVSSGSTVILTNTSFQNCSAEGGDGGTFGGTQRAGGGGGGFMGSGGTGNLGAGGGGGFYVVTPGGTTGGVSSGNVGGGGGGGGALGGVGGSPVTDRGAGGTAPQGGGSGGGTGGGGGGGCASETVNGVDAVGLTGGVSGGGTAQDGGDGSAVGTAASGGGGSGGSPAAAGGDGLDPNAGDGGSATASGFGGGGGGASDPGAPPVDAGSGGDAGDGGGGGGGGTSGRNPGNGGDGGSFGGGGGGGSSSDTGGDGGDGNFGSGGGGAGRALVMTIFGGIAGDGGFGGGGGGAGALSGFGLGGFGGGDGGAGGATTPGGLGGGGAGFGGAIFIEGSGTLEVNTFISFSGNSTVAGTGGNPGLTGGSDIFAVSGAQMNFNLSTNSVIPNPIESDLGTFNPVATGGLTKTGPALLTINGANTYTGTTDVVGGELRIAGSTTSNIEVNGGTLSGNFATIANEPTSTTGSLILNTGRFSPGVNGVGTVTLAGEFQLNGGTFAVDVTPDPFNDRVVATAAGATISGGDLEVIFGTGNYISGTVYEVIVGPVTGNYPVSNIIKTGPDAQFIEIEVTTGSLLITILTTRIFEDQVIDSGIPQEVANCILEGAENIDPNSDFAYVIALLGMLNNKEVNKALINLSPVRFGSLEWINARNNSWVADILSQHLFDLCCSPRDCCNCCANTEAWVAGYGNFADQFKRLDNLQPFHTRGGGAIAGIDWCCSPYFYFGGAAGYTYTGLDWNKDAGQGNINTYYGALYGSWHCDCFSVDLSLIGGGSDHHIKRIINFDHLLRTAKSDPWGYFGTGHLGVRGNWDCSCFTFEPFAKADYHYFYRESFTEKGADSINLKVRSNDQHFVRGEAGLRMYYTIYCDCNNCWAPYIGGSWVGDFPLYDSDQKASFIGQSCVIDVESYDSSLQMGSAEAGFKFTNECGFSLLGGYKGIFNNKVRLNQFDLRFEWIF